MKINIDRDKCVSLGLCEAASAVFELDDDAELILHEDLIASRPVNELREAVQSCPVKALTMTE
jgi:ferredoxin